MTIPLVELSFDGNELRYVEDCVKTSWISSQGSYVKKFEKLFADYHDIPYASAVSNGTAALHLALVALNIKAGDEVIVPSFTFASSVNTILFCNATPVFVEIDEESWNIDPTKIEEKITERTKAIMPVHMYGQPCNMEPILHIAKKHKLFVIEDCAEALGARVMGKRVGTLGDIGCFSFFANKTITTGEGGMTITHDEKISERINLLRDHGMSPKERYWHTAIGFNYRITNLQSAVGVAQMERIDEIVTHRNAVGNRYHKNLAGIPGLTLSPLLKWSERTYWFYAILIDPQKFGMDRQELMKRLSEQGIETRKMSYALHSLPLYAAWKVSLPITEKICGQGISLPMGNKLSLDKVDKICKAIRMQAAQNSE